MEVSSCIEELIAGRDKEVRGARVRLVGKGKPVYLKWPVQKLYPLEVQARPGGNREERINPIVGSNVRDELRQRFQNRKQRRC